MRVIAAVISVALSTLMGLSGTARGGGLEVGDSGAEALARGGAFVAKADNPTAINYNPAGFVKLRGHHIALSYNAVHTTYDFTRRSSLANEEAAAYDLQPTISNAQPWFSAPLHLMATTDLDLFDQLTLAAGFYAPSAFASQYPSMITDDQGDSQAAPQRFDLVQMGGIVLFPSLAVAFRPADWIDLGLSFQWAVSKITTTSYATVSTACERPEDPNCDIRLDIEAQDLFAPSGSIGLLIRPSSNLELGSLVRLPSRWKLEGRARVTVGSDIERLESYVKYPMMDPLDPPVTITSGYPWMVRLGARYVFRAGRREVGDIEIDGVFENWKAVSERTLTIQAFSLGKPLGKRIQDSRLQDTYALRVGGSYHLDLRHAAQLILRGGGFAESASTQLADNSLQTIGGHRLGLTLGFGLRWGIFSADLAYAHLFIPKRVVNNSNVRAQDFDEDGSGPVVGNGTYSAGVDMLSFQLTVSFSGATSIPSARRRTLPQRSILGFVISDDIIDEQP